MEMPLFKNIKTEPCSLPCEQLLVADIEIKQESVIEIGEIDETTFLQGYPESSEIGSNSNNLKSIEDVTFYDQIIKEEPVFYDEVNSQVLSYPETEEETSKSAEYSAPATNLELNDSKKQIEDKTFECYICRCETVNIGLLKWHLQERHQRERLISHRLTRSQLKPSQAKKQKSMGKNVEQNVTKKQHSNDSQTKKSHEQQDSDAQQMNSLQSQTTESKLKCRYCLRNFNTIQRVEKHERIHTNDHPFKCSVCSKGYNNKTHFEAHLRVHTGEKPFSCELCGIKFRSYMMLYNHKKAHTKGKTLPEPIPQRSNEIVEHVEPTDFPEFRLFECYLCGLRCQSGGSPANLLKVHMREEHFGRKTYQCEICSKKFARKKTIRSHRETHSKSNQCECTVCGKLLVGQKSLDLHLQTHKGEYKHECKYCHKKYSTLRILRNHIRTHTGIKPYECEHCGRGFLRQADMVRHTLIHTGERPYKCDICEATFSRNHLLTDHKRNIHFLRNNKRNSV